MINLESRILRIRLETWVNPYGSIETVAITYKYTTTREHYSGYKFQMMADTYSVSSLVLF